MLRWHQKVQKDVRYIEERSGITEGIDDVLKGMIENIDYRRLEDLQKAICESIKKFECKKNRIRLEKT